MKGFGKILKLWVLLYALHFILYIALYFLKNLHYFGPADFRV